MAQHAHQVEDSISVTDSVSVSLRRGFWAVLDNASAHVNDGRTSEAVLISQTACEVAVSRAVNALRGHLEGEVWIDLVDLAFPPNRDNSYSMMSAGARKAWTAMTGGDDLTDFGQWAAYQDHVKRRNRVAHKDERPTAAEALASVEVTGALLTYVEGVMRSILGESW